MKTQLQIFYEEHRKIAGANEVFMDLVKSGMTREDLAKNISRRPELWGKFANWLDVLPSRSEVNR
jgi:hypothetical protein